MTDFSENAVIGAIKRRRSIRAYKSDKIPREVLKAIIESGNDAPSGMNSQPWRFVVVEDKTLHKRLLEAAVPNARKLLEPLKETNPERYHLIMKRYDDLDDPIYYSAPAIIFIIGVGTYADLSCPLACQNMMLAAYSLGLGSCWVQFGSLITESEEITEALGIREGEKIFGPIVVGYPGEAPEAPQKRSPEIIWI
jgi:nitroreductase